MRKNQKGFALVIVLCVLVLLVGMIVALLTRAGTERSAAASFEASMTARVFADTVLGLVQGQINLACAQGASTAWTSQPGMVRTFDSTGLGKGAFKLYSAPDMVVGSGFARCGDSQDFCFEGHSAGRLGREPSRMDGPECSD